MNIGNLRPYLFNLCLKVFDLPDLHQTFPLTNVSHTHGRKVAVYSEETEHLDPAYNWTLSGYFQSWRYFDNVESVIRGLFQVTFCLFIVHGGKLKRNY